jgi:hypothetical protein
MASSSHEPILVASTLSGKVHPSASIGDQFADCLNNSGVVLEKVCEYMYYNEKHKDAKDVVDLDVPPELSLELLMAADYLDSKCLDTRTTETASNHATV